ncbi:AraC family transcriptional regulator [Clostridium estertheticum]|uniref:AraC family transcriptional regulator n=1 Tax=Clostridium estertheticum TaxID=238834 RepID=UPI001CF4CA50|nr:AraC family transcriptional regulator [Clostridium estertheticum]MCB2307298.1 AraC family transcriptional regulator [Clostridium estertheticum]MCB2344948.1 AraC family transcriptional regulator [Clostridium estertheticum]MCB2349890.1 AraC family transcriptional regulator [Clostridium estertheticum]WAG48187.1 AraC family transcriptional regulator [Clostridium estertheticum]
MKWLKQLSEVVDYIETNLTGVISYDEVAKIACCSTYYFQRIFSYVAEIPLSEYIRRRRMTAAAFELQTSDKKVMDIGLKYGYESPTSFNRAFQSVHGVAPTVARTKGTLLTAYSPISFSISVVGGENMNYRIETKETIRIVGARTALQEDMDQNQKIVPVFWNSMLESTLFSKICGLIDKESYGIFGVTAYTNPQNIYYYIAAPTDKPVPDGMFEFEIPAATWVVFECNGHFKESVQTIFKRFLTEWLPVSGYEYAQLPDIEVYPVSNKSSKGGHAEVWIAIKKEGKE